ncbi:MAG: hypothetical protein IIC91_12630 [Chloroflexi bacterium]|nr:hypothetical protein [Chloroflexota bacterium]
MTQSSLQTRAARLMAGALAAFAIAWVALGLASAGETAAVGDANCDGRIDSVDALLVLQLHAGLISEVCGDVDVNGDGDVNSLDAMLILQNSIVEPLPGPGPFPQPTPSEPLELTAKLSLFSLPDNEGISATLWLLNNNNWPVKRQYTSSQRYDMVVRDDTGDIVWRWSQDMAFSAVIGTNVLQPGEGISQTETWKFEDNAGSNVEPGSYELHMFDVGCGIDPIRQCDLGEVIAVDIPPPPDCTGQDGLGAGLIVSGGRETFSSGEGVSLTLVFYNCGEEAINRVYSDGRQYGFAVQDESGEIVWSWSQGATLALTDRTFEPDEMFVHRTIWRQHIFNGGELVAPGTYTAFGFDVSTCRYNTLENCDLIASQTIEIVP